jgi:hypothetical protein
MFCSLKQQCVLPGGSWRRRKIRNLGPDPETEEIAMRFAIEHERAQGRAVADVHERDLGYDITSLDTDSSELRLIEVKAWPEPKRWSR